MIKRMHPSVSGTGRYGRAVDERVRTLLRTAQTWFPGMEEAKYAFQRGVRRTLRRPFELEFRAVPLLGLPMNALILDVGANRGQTIDALHLVAPGRQVVAFEPNMVLADRLRRRYAHRSQVDVHAVGLGDVTGTFTLHVPVYNGYVFDGLASFDESAARDWLVGRLIGYNDERLEIRPMTCAVERLDDLGLAPALVKLDVQGLELQALRGARRTLARHQPALLVEAPGAELIKYLTVFGYRPYSYEDGRLVEGYRDGANTFFLTVDDAGRYRQDRRHLRARWRPSARIGTQECGR
jgi:FkbM family methyltransferase